MPPSKEPFTAEHVDEALSDLTDWVLEAGKLHRTFKFRNFVDAFGFMSKVAIVAQSLNHHPEWSNVYSTVVIDLSTHEVGGITELDLELARLIDDVS